MKDYSLSAQQTTYCGGGSEGFGRRWLGGGKTAFFRIARTGLVA